MSLSLANVCMTELINLTGKRIDFEFVDDGTRDPTDYIQTPGVDPNKTKKLMCNYITMPYTSYDVNWEVRVLMGGKSTGNKLIAYLFLCCVRIFFIEYKEGDRVRLLVLGAPSKGNMDFLRRTRWIGHLFGRKSTWDKLRLIEIATQEKDKKGTDKKIRRKKCSRPRRNH
ncbi:hypothetical protein ABFS83_01G076000 [Erythranthe nasuta]